MKHIPKGGQYPDVAADIDSLKKWDNPHIIGLHYELDLLAAKDTLDEVSEVEIADWISSIDMESKGSVRLSIGIPSGLSISLLNRVFNKFDLVFVHESGVPNINRVGNTYASELNLNDEKFVLALKGTDFADRIHLENYMASLYTSLGLSNFAFSDYSSLMEIDYKTYEKGKKIDLQPGELVASVRDQIYNSESEMNTKQQSTQIVEPNIEEAQTDTVQVEVVDSIAHETIYRIQIAASKVKLKDEILKSFKAENIREIKINDYYKYTIGNFKNRKEASEGLKEYKASSGNTAAFLVTY